MFPTNHKKTIYESNSNRKQLASRHEYTHAHKINFPLRSVQGEAAYPVHDLPLLLPLHLYALLLSGVQ
jgi:hypothetical protein